MVNLVLLLAVLYGLEIVLSLMKDPRKSLPPNGTTGGETLTWGHPVRVNSLGFREREVTMPKPAGTYRVMVLGDSLTWGVGLAEEERYTVLAEECLTGRFPGVTVEVLNFGLNGASTILERDVLRRHAGNVAPDLVVVGFCLNDPQPRVQDYSVERDRFFARHGGKLIGLDIVFGFMSLDRTNLLLRRGLFRVLEVAGVFPPWHEALERTYEVTSPEWRKFLTALGDIKALSDGMGLPPPIFAVLDQGASKGGEAETPGTSALQAKFRDWYGQAREAAAKEGFATYGHKNEIARDLQGVSLVVNELDGHPSAALNGVYGRKLCDKLVQVMEGGTAGVDGRSGRSVRGALVTAERR